MKVQRSFNNTETIKHIIDELRKIEKDEEIEINFIPNVVEEEWHDFINNYAILKNVIEIKSKRLIKTNNDNYI